MPARVVNTRLGDIEYTSIGTGTPIVFLHGGHSNCYESLCHKGFDLNRFQLITPSRPGYGRTPLNNNRTPRKSAALIAELLSTLSVEKVVIYGISAGGPTALELAANYPRLTDRLVLSSAVSKKWLRKGETTYRIAQVLFNRRIGKFTWGLTRFLLRIFPRAMASSFYIQFSKCTMQQLKREDIQELSLAMKYYRSNKGFLNDLKQDVSVDTLNKVKCPTLIVHSENDNSVSMDHAKHAYKAINGARLEILQNEWGHLFWIGADSNESIAKTLDFIEQTEIR